MKRKYTEFFEDTIKLLEQDKKDTLEMLNSNSEKLLSLKEKFKNYNQEGISLLNAAVKDNKAKRIAYNRQVKKATACINVAHDMTKCHEKQLQKEVEQSQYYKVLYEEADEEVCALETASIECRITLQNKEEEIEDLKKRINFVDESKAINYIEDQTNLNALKKLISSKKTVILELNELFKDISECVDEHSAESICIVCRSKRSQYAFNCGHLCICESCFEKSPKQCPYCRKKSNGLKIFTI